MSLSAAAANRADTMKNATPPVLSLFVPGRPIAFARAGTNGTRRYTPTPQQAYQQTLGLIARAAMSKAGYEPFAGPLEVIYRATYGWPTAWSQKRRDKTRWKASAPDIDNLCKLFLDGLGGIAFRDDAHIARLVADKVYGLPEGATVTICPIEDAETRSLAQEAA